MLLAGYIEELGGRSSKPTVKQHLAAVRMLMDYLVTGGILPLNPASSVRGPKHSMKRGKTPVLSAAEARQLLDSSRSRTRMARPTSSALATEPSSASWSTRSHA